MTKIAIICGGPSAERGISLNSARSIFDHLSADDVSFVVLYVDADLNFYHIDSAKLYSNTPSDFDFELAQSGQVLSHSEIQQTLQGCDVAFPCIHGEFGEDGQLQALLEDSAVPFVGSSAAACADALNKFKINQKIAAAGLPALDIIELDLSLSADSLSAQIDGLLAKHPHAQFVVKPRAGGSSIGVAIVTGKADILAHCEHLKQQYGTTVAVMEEFCDGQEFTVVVVQNAEGEPVALPVTEVSVQGLFGYREKYLATEATMRHCPPKTYSDAQIAAIRSRAEQIFTLFGMRDMARFDGFLTADDKIYFNDLNPISGMEQNSFFFQQISRVGWRHQDLLRYVVNRALARGGKTLLTTPSDHRQDPQPVWVLFGGNSGEKEVSVMSGTNIWLKLAKSEQYQPTPFLLSGDSVWQLPYAFCLDHTVAEIRQNCENAAAMQARVAQLASDIQSRLAITHAHQTWQMPTHMALDDFLLAAQQAGAFVFLGLHGGDGENGVLQTKLDALGVHYNGPNPNTSRLCMDKYASGMKVIESGLDKVTAAPKLKIDIASKGEFSAEQATQFYQQALGCWEKLQAVVGEQALDFAARSVLIKPQSDGCSLGIVQLQNAQELQQYSRYMGENTALPPKTFASHDGIIEMNFDPTNGLLLEPFIETVKLRTHNHEIQPKQVNGWIELTVGVVYQYDALHALVPSITISEDSVLSLEEKFQGGTGVNLTPPPPSVVTEAQCQLIRRQIENIAAVLNIDGYARIDIFFHTVTEHIIFIEANTLPGLTPSTVIYHQALADAPSRTPTEFLAHLVQTKQQNQALATAKQQLWSLQDIAQAVNGQLVGAPALDASSVDSLSMDRYAGEGDLMVSGLSIDSRTVAPGDLFIALAEGYQFVDDALSKGAIASLTAKAVTEPYILVSDTQQALEQLGQAAQARSTQTQRVAVTGSVGKTGVTQALAQVLSSAGACHRPVASYNNHIGVPLTLARMPAAMPFGVFELGMNNPGEIRALTAMVKPNIAMITKIGNAHSSNFVDGVQGIANAKAEIFEGLSPGGVAIINRDCDWYPLIKAKADAYAATVLTFSTTQAADAQLLSYRESETGSHIEVNIAQHHYAFTLALRGQHWAENALPILLVAHTLQLNMLAAIQALTQVQPLNGRGAVRTIQMGEAQATLIDDSYNANPDSMIAAFKNLHAYPGAKRKIAVLTDMLEQSDAANLHASLAEPLAAAQVDKVFLAGAQMQHLYAALPEPMRGHHAASAQDLISELKSSLRDGDVVLVKGSNGSGAWKIAAALTSG